MKQVQSFIRSLFNSMKQLTVSVVGWVTLVFCTVTVAYMYLGFLKILVAPFAPLITFLFAIWGTVYACRYKSTAMLSMLGIAIYVASWPSATAWGANIGMMICTAGFLIWLMAIYFAFDLRHPQPRTEVA